MPAIFVRLFVYFLHVASHVDQNADCNFTAPCHLLWHYGQTHANKVPGILYLLR